MDNLGTDVTSTSSPVTHGSVDNSNVASSSASLETSQSTEKMLPQSKVDSIVRDRVNRLRAEHEQQISDLRNSYSQPQQPSSMGGMEQLSQDSIRQMIADETKKQQDKLSQEYLNYVQAQQANELVNRVKQKFEAAKEKYPDFEEKVSALQVDKIPAIISLVDSVDNSADVMMDLAENPHKIANILQFANDQNTYHLAQLAMTRLSNSIKANEEARNQPNVRQPLSQIKPSTTGTDNGKKGVRDLRRENWLRA